MRLGFVYYEPNNNNFKKNLIRYNTLLKKYFESNNSTIVNKLNETFGNILKESISYELLTSEESEVYNVIIEFLANSLNPEEIAKVKNQEVNDDIRVRIAERISTQMPQVDLEIVKQIIDKSQNILKNSDSKNIEVVFIPSIISIE